MNKNMKIKIYRQGDIGIKAIDKLPDNLKETKDP